MFQCTEFPQSQKQHYKNCICIYQSHMKQTWWTMCTSSVRRPECVLNIRETIYNICYIGSLMIMCITYGAMFATHLLHLQCHGVDMCLYALIWHICEVSDMNKLWMWSEYELYLVIFSEIINKNILYRARGSPS